MATALPNNPELECSICFEHFKTPKIISCGHSFCLKCLVRYIDGRQSTFQCPFCKQDVKIPRGGVNKFVTNFSLQTLTDSLITTDSSTTQPSTRLKPKHHCPNHTKKEVEYFCQTCSLGLCSKCIYRDHNDHKTLDLECDSTREMIVEELSNSKPFIKRKLEDLENTYAILLETSEKLKSFCDEACTEISEKTEKIIGELRKRCKKIQKDINLHFDNNKSQLTETQQKVMTQITNIETVLDISTTEEPTLTLIYSLTKLQDLQNLCENMKTDIPPVTYEEWREGNYDICDILGSTETKTLHPPITRTVFKFNYKDIKFNDPYYNEDKCISNGIVLGCRVWRWDGIMEFLDIHIGLRKEDNPLVNNCNIKYTLTVINKDSDKNWVINDNETMELSPDFILVGITYLWNKLIDPSEGFIDNEGQFCVRLDLQEVLDIKYKKSEVNRTYCRLQ